MTFHTVHTISLLECLTWTYPIALVTIVTSQKLQPGRAGPGCSADQQIWKTRLETTNGIKSAAWPVPVYSLSHTVSIGCSPCL